MLLLKKDIFALQGCTRLADAVNWRAKKAWKSDNAL